ncbi:MAG: hypothetical protein L0Z46_01730 [Nitrospiraceae bacterium]|nr:hypothetical protein [Nitrospiraceae bacterium]
MKGSSKLPKDLNQLAAAIVRLSTEEEPAKAHDKPVTSSISQYLAKIGQKGGLKGGHARAKKLSGKQRRAIAKKAATARWRKAAKKNR